MAKLITVKGAAGRADAPRIIRTPGVAGYASRFIAGHIDSPIGAVVTRWEPVAGDNPQAMVALAGTTSTVTLQEEAGSKYLRSPGNALGGGRLISPNIAQRPVTMAAVIRTPVSVERSVGITGSFITRNANGSYQGTSGSSAAYTLENRSGWIVVILAQAADNSFVVRAGAYEAQSAAGSAVPATYSGMYFGASEAGDVADIKELIYWDKQLDLAERNAVHGYLLSRYPNAV